MRHDTRPGMFQTLGVVVLAVAMSLSAGCAGRGELAKLPGLKDVQPVGPDGRVCYQRCAKGEVVCKKMCPGASYECIAECMLDTKACLSHCPELRPIKPPPPK